MRTTAITDSGAAGVSVHVGDISMSCRMAGNGTPLLLIMGYGSTMNLWELALVERLAARYKVIVFDNRGTGGTTAGTKPFSVGQFAEDTAGLMDALGIRQAHVLGWSMGSLIAQELVLRYPRKVLKLVLYATYCDGGMFPPAPEVVGQLTDMTGTPEERGMRFISALFPGAWLQSNGARLGEIFFRPMGNLPGEILQRQSLAIDEWQGSTDRLGEIHSSVLLITGTEDCLVPSENSRFMSEKLPDAQLDMVAGGGHGLMFQSPDLFADKVTAFLG